MGVQVINHYFLVIVSLIPIVAYRDIKIKAGLYSDYDFSWTSQKEPMCPRQTAALLGPVGRSTLQKEAVTVCYIIEGMTEKLYRVLLDAGDMTSL